VHVGRSSLIAPALAVVVVACGSPIAPAQPAPPPGYIDVEGSPDLFINPGNVPAQGSTYTQNCVVPDGVTPPGPGEVLWHFILPQSVTDLLGGLPQNIFASLTVEFASAGVVTLTTFGPPNLAHAWITTPTDDTLLGPPDALAEADIFRLIVANRGNEPNFNLSHTCFVPQQETTTSTTIPAATTSSTTTTPDETAPPTTAPPTTAEPTAAGPSTSISSGGGTTSTTAVSGGGTTTTTIDPGLPVTGVNDRLAIAALIVLALGALLAVLARRPTSG
jgi:hypothetical protein